MYEDLNPLYFMVGLGSFLVAHILYALVYGRMRWASGGDSLHKVHRLRMAFPVVLAGTGLIVILYPSLGELRIPVVIYALVLMVMVINALFRYQQTTFSSFFMVTAGAVFFMISDSVLAINKFLEPVPGAGVWIMGTYVLAQFLIIQGLLRHSPQLINR